MTSTPLAGELSDPHDRELDDLITSHLDGGLDAAGQRRLAALLAATPEARATLARYLRLESALLRIARVGGIGTGIATDAPPAPCPQIAAPPAVRPAWRIRRTAIALAGSAVAAAIALFVIGRPDRPTGQAADIAAVAEQWIDLRTAEAADAAETPRAAAERTAAEIDTAAAAPEGVEPDWAEDEATEPNRGSPPSWLVAAIADDDKV
jgi:anti-sigma factor RsiW